MSEEVKEKIEDIEVKDIEVVFDADELKIIHEALGIIKISFNDPVTAKVYNIRKKIEGWFTSKKQA